MTKALNLEPEMRSGGQWQSLQQKDLLICASFSDYGASLNLRSKKPRTSPLDVRDACRQWNFQRLSAQEYDMFLPLRSDAASKRFYSDDDFNALHHVEVSGWADRVETTLELISERFAYGRLALQVSFAGSNASSSTAPAASDTAPPKDNLQKFFSQGGDLGLSFETPLFLHKKLYGSDGFITLLFNPRLAAVAPQLGSSVPNAAVGLEPGLRLYWQIVGLTKEVTIYADSWGGLILGSKTFYSYVNRDSGFFTANVAVGLNVEKRFQIGLAGIVAGPLAGDNGITVTVSALTGT